MSLNVELLFFGIQDVLYWLSSKSKVGSSRSGGGENFYTLTCIVEALEIHRQFRLLMIGGSLETWLRLSY